MKLTDAWTQIEGRNGTGEDDDRLFARKTGDDAMELAYRTLYGVTVVQMPLFDVLGLADIGELQSAFDNAACILMDDYEAMFCGCRNGGENKIYAVDSCYIVTENGVQSDDIDANGEEYDVSDLHGAYADLLTAFDFNLA